MRSPAVVGILNVTPDSFSDGGEVLDPVQVVARARQHVAQGATVLDVGGESTRPGFVAVTTKDELARVLPALAALRAAELGVALSVDTRHAAVAARALEAGAHVINDVSALADSDMAHVCAKHGAIVVLMHGFAGHCSHDTNKKPAGVADVVQGLAAARDRAVHAGILPQHIWLDPGLGFGKDAGQNLRLTAELSALLPLEAPLVYGPSRKRFLGQVTGHDDPVARDAATAASCAIAVTNGADLLRVHNPAAVRDAVAVAAAVRNSVAAEA